LLLFLGRREVVLPAVSFWSVNERCEPESCCDQ
jgi:hypothetical protein